MIVHVVQPVLPQYRIPFFRRVQERLDKQGMTLRVYASSRDQLGVESVSADGFTAELGPAMSCFLGGRILWQRQLNVPLHSGDVLVLNGNPRLLSNYPLWVRAKRLGVPVLWWGHGWSAGSHGMAAAIRRQIMRIPDGVILYTEKEREQFLALGFSARRTCALNNGLDVESVNAAASAWTEVTLELLNTSTPIFFSSASALADRSSGYSGRMRGPLSTSTTRASFGVMVRKSCTIT